MKEKTTEKKKLRLNIIDVIVILLLVAVVVVGAIKLADVRAEQARANDASDSEPISGPPEDFVPNVRFEVLAEGVSREVAETVVNDPNNRLCNSFRLLNAYIVSAELEPCMETVLAADGTLVEAENPARANIRFVIDAYVMLGDYYTIVNGNFNTYLGSQDLRIGKQYIVKTMTVEVTGITTALQVLEVQDD